MDQLLASLKGRNFNKQDYQKLIQVAKTQDVKTLNLWKLKPELKALFSMGKIQTYMLLLAGLTILPYTLYQKYQQDNKKLIKLTIFAPFAFGVCFFPHYYYRRFSKTLLQQINYNFQNKKIQILHFKTKKVKIYDTKQVKYTLSDKNRIKTISFSQVNLQKKQENIQNKLQDKNQNQKNNTIKKSHQIQGLGQWESIQLFKYVLQNCQ